MAEAEELDFSEIDSIIADVNATGNGEVEKAPSTKEEVPSPTEMVVLKAEYGPKRHRTAVMIDPSTSITDAVAVLRAKRRVLQTLMEDVEYSLCYMSMDGKLSAVDAGTTVQHVLDNLQTKEPGTLLRLAPTTDVENIVIDRSRENEALRQMAEEVPRPVWQDDSDAPECTLCALKFTFKRRRHHCRNCGMVVCRACCEYRDLVEMGYDKPVLICSECDTYKILGPSKRMTTHVDALRRPSVQGESYSRLAGAQDEFLIVKRIIVGDPLGECSAREKDLVWNNRHRLTNDSKALCWVLRALVWSDEGHVSLVPSLLAEWAPPDDGVVALELLAARFPSRVVHLHAVQYLALLSEEEVVDYLPQLVQAMKSETLEEMAEEGSLAEFVLERARKRPEVCHFLYWNLMAEIHSKKWRRMFEYLRKQLFKRCCTEEQRLDFLQQHALLRHLESAQRAVREADGGKKTAALHAALSGIDFACPCRLPANPFVCVDGFVVDECRVMASHAQPILVTLKVHEAGPAAPKGDIAQFHDCFMNVASTAVVIEDLVGGERVIRHAVVAWAEKLKKAAKGLKQAPVVAEVYSAVIALCELADNLSEEVLAKEDLERATAALQGIRGAIRDTAKRMTQQTVAVIYKEGDDLRQDILAMQAIRVLTRLWRSTLGDLFGTTYGCVATGENVGLIEVIPRATTVAAIHRTSGVRGVFKLTGISEWLASQPRQYFERIGDKEQRFLKSCVAYSVATYILGVGDRHNDNIMLADDGRLFHIDFGLILGQWQKFCGISRDRVPFVLTADFINVFCKEGEEEGMKEFKRLCYGCYLSARKHARTIISLFGLMLTCGMPTLSTSKDMDHLRSALIMRASKGDAIATFESLIEKSVSSQAAQLNFFVHNVAALAANPKRSSDAVKKKDKET